MLDEKLDRLIERHAALARRMAAPEAGAGDGYARIAKEYAELSPVVEVIEALRATREEIAGLDEMIAAESDPEMRRMAEDERAALAARLSELERRVKLLLLPRDEADTRNVILEVRAGTGGEEAALFAADLLRMYQRYEIGRAHV